MPATLGKLIALEGIDGSGTTTQAKRLAAWMNGQGLETHLTCEPSNGPLGQLLRRFLKRELPSVDAAALALLFAADRVDHVQSEILPQLQRGLNVVTDRYVYSSLAYQSLDLELSWVAQINGLAPEPDLTCYLRVDPLLARSRRDGRGEDEEIFDADPLQQRIARRYDEIFESTGSCGIPLVPPLPPGSRRIQAAVVRRPSVKVLDGARTIAQLQQDLRNLVQKICPPLG
jgi:dTMP kinase